MQGYPHPHGPSSADPYNQPVPSFLPPSHNPHQQQPRNHDLGPDPSTAGSKRKAQQLDDDDDEKPNSETASQAGAAGGGGAAKGKGGASDFVKKLYKMLDDGQFSDVVSWGYTGDSFVVKDMNQFTTHILPLHFKHSNFASFVRQLNKYDFHKVKNAEEGQNPYGDNTWEFKHPNFRADMKDNLENIKRKAPAAKKAGPTGGNRMRASALSGNANSIDPSLSGGHSNASDLSSFQQQLDGLAHTQQAMQQHMNNLSADYQAVIGEMMNFQRNMVAQDQLMQNIIQFLVNLEADQRSPSAQDPSTPFVPSSQAQKLISSYTEVARASYDQMADLSRRASLSGGAFPQIPMPPPPPNFGHFEFAPRRDDDGRRGGPEVYDSQGQQQGQRAASSSHQAPPSQQGGQAPPQGPPPGSQHQQQHPSPQQPAPPTSAQFQHPAYDPSSGPSPSPSDTRPSPQRHQSNVPGWAVPPRVLLVEDDAVCRKLSSKFLEVFGCQIDVAVDGVSAVNKMNVQKYDLVLMDIVMPNLDGVSATSLIRQFDPMTPIISMTSNSGPNDIMTYFSHGMNDILPKPFTKENLLGMLEKHLVHLKLIQQMAEIPRALGFTDHQIQDALAQSVMTDAPDGGGGQVLNPFSSMGISDQDYVEMLQGIAMEKEGKRGLEVISGEGRVRFQEGELVASRAPL
ncbi:hypothetical protein JCM1841_000174 [Sporobolomyces salmonicolor]